MTPETWSPAFSVGHPVLDGEHQKLLRILADLKASCQDNTIGGNLHFHELLNDLTEYARLHFLHEEALLAACNYPDLVSHEAEHMRCLERLTQITFDAIKGKLGKQELLDFLDSWWLHHILGSDLAYKPFVDKDAPDLGT